MFVRPADRFVWRKTGVRCLEIGTGAGAAAISYQNDNRGQRYRRQKVEPMLCQLGYSSPIREGLQFRGPRDFVAGLIPCNAPSPWPSGPPRERQIQGSIPASDVGIFPGRVIQVT